jgi:GT2 family glycosyltransferase
MPTYNGATHLPAALASIRAQGNPDIEVVVVDDGSTDATPRVLDVFAKDVSLEVISQTHSGNWAANSNLGLARARGDWVCFLHQDDLWAPGRLDQLRRLMLRRPRAAFLLHSAWYVDAQGQRAGRWRCPLPADEYLDGQLLVGRLLVQNFIAMPAPLVRRSAALSVGGLDDSLWYTADWDLWLKLARSAKAVYLPKSLASFRIHPLSQTWQRSERMSDFRRQMEVVFDRHFYAWNPSAPDKSAVERVARFSLEVNTLLATSAHGHRLAWRHLCYQFLALGPAGGYRFLRDSRLLERVIARLRAGLIHSKNPLPSGAC